MRPTGPHLVALALTALLGVAAAQRAPECESEPVPNVVAWHRPDGRISMMARTCPRPLQDPADPSLCWAATEDVAGEQMYFVRDIGERLGDPLFHGECARPAPASPSTTPTPSTTPSVTPTPSFSSTPSAMPSALHSADPLFFFD